MIFFVIALLSSIPCLAQDRVPLHSALYATLQQQFAQQDPIYSHDILKRHRPGRTAS